VATIDDIDLSTCLFVTGPTAGGKTAIGLELADRVGGEIISMDSMAVYRGMDIGTAKPSPEDQRRAPHHLIDLVEPAHHYSIAQYVADARQKVHEIRSRGRCPIFVGGTPLYLKSLLRGIFVGPPADMALRGRLTEIAATQGSAALHAKLATVDPRTARRLHPRDTRRLIRALEVFELMGKPISELQGQFDRARGADELWVFAITWNKAELQSRIDARVERMFAQGLVDEARRLTAEGKVLGKTASQAVGYREVLDCLAGRSTLAEAIALTKLRTRQFAKRQMTWLRSLSECRSLAVSEPLDAAAVADKIAAIYDQGKK